MAAAAVDTAYLASYSAFPKADIDILLDQPSPDLIRSFLESITKKAADHERSESECLRLGVELENALHGRETKARSQKANTEKAVKESNELRTKLAKEGWSTLSCFFSSVLADKLHYRGRPRQN